MASNYAPIAAFDFVKRYTKNMPLEQVFPQILDDTLKMMWMAAPWRWTIGAFPNIALATNTQDYSVAIPSDFLYLIDSYLTDQQGNIPRVLTIEPTLAAGGTQGNPSEITIIGAAGTTGTARFFPQPGSLPSNIQAISLYKKTAPSITASNANTAGIQVFDDEWFWVFNSGVLYYAYLFGDDERAGGAQIDPVGNKVTFNGQRGVFEANLQVMKQREKLLSLHTSPEAAKLVQ